MKLLGISASNRRDGNSYLILKEALPDAEIIQFADLEIKPCTHCEHNRVLQYNKRDSRISWHTLYYGKPSG